MNIDLDEYKPLIDTSTLDDNVLELWYGSKFAVRFLRLIEGCEIKVDFEKYPNSIFYFKNDKYMLEYNIKNEDFWISYPNIWSILVSELDYNYQKIKDLITSILEQHFKQKVVTTKDLLFSVEHTLEQHFIIIDNLNKL